MAIHRDYPNLTAEIVVNGVTLREYDDHEKPPPKTTTTYVEVASEDYFGVRYAIPAELFEEHSVMATVIVEGEVLQRISQNKKLYEGKGATGLVERSGAVIASKSFEQRLRFAKLETCVCSLIEKAHVLTITYR